MIEANDLKYGIVIKSNDELYLVLETQHVKPGKGPAYVRAKLKNFLKGNVIEKTFRSNEKIEDIYIERRNMQFLYKADDEYTFMDNKSYEQVTLTNDIIGESTKFLKEGMNVEIQFYNETPISVILPTFVELKVVSTEPGLKGDTVSTPMKPAKVETGATIMVPLFINEGDIIKIDTRTNTYIERV